MISICVPIYNFNVTELVKTLSEQSQKLDCPSEIILIDDCSDISFKKLNESICSNEHYIQLEKNIGRAAIRNRFLEYTKYEYLLFLDCDMVIPSNDFLIKYVEAIKSQPNHLICGGKKFLNIPPKEKSKMLRWKYGSKIECKTAEERRLNPNKSFITSNFVVPKTILDSIKFDERLSEYGHEDTLFGFELKKKNFNIIHIENPVLSEELVDNIEYISNNEKAISNLVSILKFTNYDSEFIQDVNVLRVYYKLYKIRKLIALMFLIFKPLIKFSLIKGYINLDVFNFYKLGTLTLKMNH